MFANALDLMAGEADEEEEEDGFSLGLPKVVTVSDTVEASA